MILNIFDPCILTFTRLDVIAIKVIIIDLVHVLRSGLIALVHVLIADLY